MRNQGYTISYRIILFFVFMYQLPITILVALNAKLLLALHRANSYRANMRQSNGHKYGPKSNRSVTLIVVAVVSICVVCNITAMVSHLLWSLIECYRHKFSHLDSYRRYTSLVSNVLVTFNCAVNFIIYCLCSRNFRLILSRTCRCYRLRGTGLGGGGKKPKVRQRWSSVKGGSSVRTQLNGTYISLVPYNISTRTKMASIMWTMTEMASFM